MSVNFIPSTFSFVKFNIVSISGNIDFEILSVRASSQTSGLSTFFGDFSHVHHCEYQVWKICEVSA